MASVTENTDKLSEEATSKEVVGLEGNLEAVLSYPGLN
jgi:NAD-dependent SIR2 family protein deacetylase